MRPHCNVSYEEVEVRDNFFMDVRGYLGWICGITGVCPDDPQEYEDQENVAVLVDDSTDSSD